MLLGRRQYLAGALAALGNAAIGASPRAALAAAPSVDPAFRALPKHLQVFRTPPEDWPKAVEFCREFGFGTVAISIAPSERRRLLADRAAAARAFEPLARSGLHVRCMIGEGSWVRPNAGRDLPPNLMELLALHDRVFRFQALLLDVEPHVLPEWKQGDRAPLVRGTLRFLERAREACAGRGLTLSAALAPWYTRTPDPGRAGRNFLDGCLERLDEVLLMAYRNAPGEILHFAREALDALARQPRPCWVGVTTQANNAPGSTYHGMGLERLQRDAAGLYQALRADPAGASIQGIAFHQFSTLRQMDG